MNFNWQGGSPVPGSSGNNRSAEWTGQAVIPCTGTYQWCVTGDDGRAALGGRRARGQRLGLSGTDHVLRSQHPRNAGTAHDIKFDYFQGGGGSVAELQWNSSCAGTARFRQRISCRPGIWGLAATISPSATRAIAAPGFRTRSSGFRPASARPRWTSPRSPRMHGVSERRP